jgi:cardiolipin synthase
LGIIEQIIFLIFIANAIGAIITVFRKPRNITTIWAWLLTLIFFTGHWFFDLRFLWARN